MIQQHRQLGQFLLQSKIKKIAFIFKESYNLKFHLFTCTCMLKYSTGKNGPNYRLHNIDLKKKGPHVYLESKILTFMSVWRAVWEKFSLLNS